MKTELTKSEQELTIVVKNEWVALAHDRNVYGIDKLKLEKGVNWLYDKYLKLPPPQIVYCDGLIEAIIKITLVKNLGKTIEDYSPQMVIDYNNGVLDREISEFFDENYNLKSTYIGWSNFGWVSFYDYFTRIGVINNEDFNIYKELISSNIYETFEFENVVFAVQPPSEIIKNENDQLHNPKGYAIKFNDGSEFYFINGRAIDKKLIKNGFTKEEFLAETNEDTRGAMFEIIEATGEGAMMSFLDAYEYKKETIKHKNGANETVTLYRTNDIFPELTDMNGNVGVPLCWVRIVCPSTEQNYLISTDASLQTPVEALKYHRNEDIPFDLEYSWSSRS